MWNEQEVGRDEVESVRVELDLCLKIDNALSIVSKLRW